MLLRRQRLHARRSQCSLSMARSWEGMEGFYLTYKILPYFPIQLAEAGATGEAGAPGAEATNQAFIQNLKILKHPLIQNLQLMSFRSNQAVGRSSHKMIEATMQSTTKGKIQTILQAYFPSILQILGVTGREDSLLGQANDILESINEYIDDAEMMDKMTTKS
ncbi:hypothetical protein SUGI_0076690 [Cryptomeria japonica]|nr:hypothetical protein SUGI_0076690 [Cryptomeria japonica]